MNQMIRKLSLSCLLAVLISFTIPPAFAQDTAAQLSGTVLDSSGSVVPNAHLTIQNAATNLSKETDSDGNGAYIFRELPPGVYTLTIKAEGFSIYLQKGLELTVEQHATLPVHLKVGGSSSHPGGAVFRGFWQASMLC